MSTTPPDEPPRPAPNPYEPPQASGSRPLSVVKGTAVGFLVAMASLIAFAATCVPLGFATADKYGFLPAIISGVVVALLTGFALSRIFLKGRQR